MGYSVGGIDVLFTDMDRPETHNPRAGAMHYTGLNEGTTVLKKGSRKRPGAMALPCDMLWQRDVPVALRDGTRIRVDIFRPVVDSTEEQRRVPAVAAWSPYGKTGVGFPNLEYLPFRAGIPEEMLSGYEKFEGPDPAVLVAHGYACVSADQRGVWDSEGDFVWNSSQEGRDGADLIEWIGTQDWCTGKVGMSGNSWLSQAMWHIAAEQPKHLAAIAPWEGHSDFYRETWCRGGVPSGGFWEFLSSWLRGRGRKEDVRAMLDKYPTMNAYWEDKCAKMSRINVPAYILASYSTGLHTYGSVRGFREIACKDKWLRFHPFQEWFDLYQPQNVADMIKFFDCYLKGEENGWEETPRVRLSLIGMGEHAPVVNQPEEDYPLARTDYQRLYLDGKTLSRVQPTSETVVSYRADHSEQADGDRAEFAFRFEKRTDIAGFAKLCVFVSCADHDDLDIFVQLRKLDTEGKEMSQINYPLKTLQDMAGVKTEADVPWFNITRHLGPTGILRASHRALDKQRATDFDPQVDLTQEAQQKISPGDVVRVEIAFWPCGLFFEAGESLKLVVAGHQLQLKEFPEINERNFNKGSHNLHMGGKYDSYLQIPVI